MSKRNRHKNKKKPKPDNKSGGGFSLVDRLGKDFFNKIRKQLNNEKSKN
jgi:hypothetical protein